MGDAKKTKERNVTNDFLFRRQVAAVVVLSKGSSGSAAVTEEIKDWCKDKMPPYTIPSQWVVLDSLPRNAMGKVNKKELVKSVFPDS